MSSNGIEMGLHRDTMQGEQKMNEEHEEYQYLSLIEKVIETGAKKKNRTDVETYSIFGAQMRFGLRDGKYIIRIIHRIICNTYVT